MDEPQQLCIEEAIAATKKRNSIALMKPEWGILRRGSRGQISGKKSASSYPLLAQYFPSPFLPPRHQTIMAEMPIAHCTQGHKKLSDTHMHLSAPPPFSSNESIIEKELASWHQS
uniref:Uncharacterized protein n=1 Tax=Ditylenchus dipsaci TaxID=166011 RepID=A0A915DXB3_9BILA